MLSLTEIRSTLSEALANAECDAKADYLDAPEKMQLERDIFNLRGALMHVGMLCDHGSDLLFRGSIRK